MSKELTQDDLHEQAKSYRQVASNISDKRDSLKAQIMKLKGHEAPREKIKELETEISLLEQQIPNLISQAESLDAAVIVNVMTNLENAKQQIEATTDKVLEAVQKFNDTKELLRVVSVFIRLGTAIVAIKGTPSAQIASLVSEVDDLTRNL